MQSAAMASEGAIRAEAGAAGGIAGAGATGAEVAAAAGGAQAGASAARAGAAPKRNLAPWGGGNHLAQTHFLSAEL